MVTICQLTLLSHAQSALQQLLVPFSGWHTKVVTVDKYSHRSKNMIPILLLNQGNLCAGFDLSLLPLACCLSS